MAVVEDRDKTHSLDQFSTPSIPMKNDYTRDLINKFMASEAEVENQRRRSRYAPLPTIKPVQSAGKVDDGEDYELSLGLSMNGRFGFDPNAKKIKRTASIPESSSVMPVTGNRSGSANSNSGGGNLIRTCSLPAESREEWLRRKELQSQRRMEARRRKNEKKRQSRAARDARERLTSAERGVVTEGGGENSNNSNNNNNLVQQGVTSDGLMRTTSLVRRVGGIVLNNEKEIDQVVPLSPLPSGPVSPPPSGGSIGSSSGTSESDGQQLGQETENPNSGKIDGPQNKTKDAKNPLDYMPSVSTKGNGPNGKRIEGFLYNYGKGEAMRILCVCHGNFLTPAEFVKHAGGDDVINPLKHIVVSSRSS